MTKDWPDEALSKLRQLVNIVDALRDAVWYEQGVRHPAISPVIDAYAKEEVAAFLRSVQDQS